jgi:hypothetical protein
MKQIWERGETRRLRPFADLNGALKGVKVQLVPDSEPIEQPSILAEQIDLERLYPILLLPQMEDETLNGLPIPRNDIEFAVIVEDRPLKRSEVVFRSPLAEVPSTLELFPRAEEVASWSLGTWLHATLVLAVEQDRRPGQAWRKGTWLAKKSFAITEPPTAYSFDPKPVPGSHFESLGLPKETTHLVFFFSTDLDQPASSLKDVLEIRLHEDVFAALSQNPDHPASRALMASIAADVITTALAVGYGALEEDEPMEDGILDVLTQRLQESTRVPAATIREFAREAGSPKLHALAQSAVRLQREIISAARRRMG